MAKSPSGYRRGVNAAFWTPGSPEASWEKPSAFPGFTQHLAAAPATPALQSEGKP